MSIAGNFWANPVYNMVQSHMYYNHLQNKMADQANGNPTSHLKKAHLNAVEVFHFGNQIKFYLDPNWQKNIEQVRLDLAEVIEAGGNINYQGEGHLESPMHHVVESYQNDEDQITVLSIFIQNGAMLNLLNSKGETPVQVASRKRRHKVASFLMENGGSEVGEINPTMSQYPHWNGASQKIQVNKPQPKPITQYNTQSLSPSLPQQRQDLDVTQLPDAHLFQYNPEYTTQPWRAGDYPTLYLSNLTRKDRTTIKPQKHDLNTQEGVELYDACANGDMYTIGYTLKGGTNPCSLKDGFPCLFAAANFDKLEACQLLLEYGAQIDQQSKAGATPLYIAAQYGLSQMCRFLIEQGADVHFMYQGFTCADVAQQHGFPEVANLFRCNGVSVNQCGHVSSVQQKINQHSQQVITQNTQYSQNSNFTGGNIGGQVKHQTNIRIRPEHNTQLVNAVLNQDISYVKQCLENGADPNAKHTDGQPCIYIAAAVDNQELCEVLVNFGADVNSKSDEGATPLYIAAQLGYRDVCYFLLDKGADLNVRFKGYSSAYIAVQNNKHAVLHVLLRQGLDPNEECHGKTLLQEAIECGHYTCEGILKDKGASVDKIRTQAKHDFGSELYDACYNGNKSEVEKFLRLGTNPDYERETCTCLFAAADRGFADICTLLIDYGAKVDHVTNSEATPLYVAAQNGHLEVCKKLIERKANVYHRLQGYTCSYVAVQEGHYEIVELFLNQGVSIDEESHGVSLLQEAMDSSHQNIVNLFMDKKSSMMQNLRISDTNNDNNKYNQLNMTHHGANAGQQSTYNNYQNLQQQTYSSNSTYEPNYNNKQQNSNGQVFGTNTMYSPYNNYQNQSYSSFEQNCNKQQQGFNNQNQNSQDLGLFQNTYQNNQNSFLNQQNYESDSQNIGQGNQYPSFFQSQPQQSGSQYLSTNEQKLPQINNGIGNFMLNFNTTPKQEKKYKLQDSIIGNLKC